MSVLDGVPDAALRESVLQRLRRLVELESPSGDELRLRALAGDFAAELTGAGAAVETEDVPGVGEHVIGRIEGRDQAAAPTLVLGHLDTVHAAGSFEPVFRTGDGVVRGPGVYDMKGGLACMLEALGRLHAAGAQPARPVVVLATCDEETGSESSRGLIEGLAEGARAVLVPEPPLPDGGAKTRRRGVGWYRLEVTGRAAHAGVDPEAGVNAVVELAHQLLAVAELGDAGRGTTVTPGEARGGTAANVVPERAHATIDVRFTAPAEGERVDAALRSLRPVLDGAGLELSGGINRPPVERTEAIGALYEAARALAEADGWTLGEGGSGGASDGSLTAGMGVPTLDGIGPRGSGAHSPREQVRLEDLPRRVRLYTRLLETL